MSAEKYLSFQISKLHFKDSMNFLNTSLDNLVNNLKNSKYDFPCLKKHCKYIKNDTDLLKREHILMNIWIVLKNSMIQNYLNMKNFIQK